MGLIGRLLGGGARELSSAVSNVADGFRPNATKAMELGHDAYRAALEQHGTEFQYGRVGLFDSVMNGLNRLPRPMLALGTLGLFVFAMVDPAGFAPRMEGLALVPEPLWWLLGAIVSFYFGARELHYARGPQVGRMAGRVLRRVVGAGKRKEDAPQGDRPSSNPALDAWRSERGG